MTSNQKDIQALKKYIEEPTEADDMKLDILQWMSDNVGKINYPDTQDDKFQNELITFVRLTVKRER